MCWAVVKRVCMLHGMCGYLLDAAAWRADKDAELGHVIGGALQAVR